MAEVVRVGLNLLFLGEHSGGVGRASLELVTELGARPDVQLELFVGGHAPMELLALGSQVGARVTRVPGGGRPGLRGAVAEYVALPLAAIGRRLDVLHSVGNAGPVTVPGVATVITVHDMIWRRAGTDWGDEQARRAMDRAVGRAVRGADLVVCASRDAASDIGRDFALTEDRLAVVLYGVRPASIDDGAAVAARDRFGLGAGPVVLCVAQKRPYKNHEAVIRALHALDDPAATLVLPGAPTAYEADLQRLAAALGVSDQVRFVGWVSDAELDGLYADATVVMLPSRIEGFGFPVLEAMVRGVPVICSSTTALGEVAGDAAVLVDPDDQAKIDAALRRVLAEPELRADLAARGSRRADEFTWSRTAEQTVAAYRRAIASRA